jgi:hypothetical protein
MYRLPDISGQNESTANTAAITVINSLDFFTEIKYEKAKIEIIVITC